MNVTQALIGKSNLKIAKCKENNEAIHGDGQATKESEAGVMPSEGLLTQMGDFIEELVKAGVMISGEALQASSNGARVRFSGQQSDSHPRAIR